MNFTTLLAATTEMATGGMWGGMLIYIVFFGLLIYCVFRIRIGCILLHLFFLHKPLLFITL